MLDWSTNLMHEFAPPVFLHKYVLSRMIYRQTLMRLAWKNDCAYICAVCDRASYIYTAIQYKQDSLPVGAPIY